MKKLIKNNINWIGKIDWELRKFHGNELSTNKGSSYNAYLVQEEKTALIDTVWAPFAKEFVDNLKSEIDLTKIDYIIANHGEIDHSGALPELMRHIPNTPIYCTANGIKSLKGIYHQNWNFKPVKTGDKLSLGNNKELLFIEAPMLHWPDNMMCHLSGDNVLFSNDIFGQHYASEYLFNDLVDQHDLFYEAMKYYANIITPFSAFVTKKINEFMTLNLATDVICTSHGIIWRKNPTQIVEQYLAWANNYQENQISIVYDTMWDGSRVMAENIARGICAIDKNVNVKLFNAAKNDKNDVITEVFKSKAIVLGSPTVNKGILTSIAAFLEETKGLQFKNKKAAVFGCYGWGGEGTKILGEQMRQMGWDVLDESLRVAWNPDGEAIAKCHEFGEKLTNAWK